MLKVEFLNGLGALHLCNRYNERRYKA